jgi:fucose 4-O-acetylase-like acetyltransferase
MQNLAPSRLHSLVDRFSPAIKLDALPADAPSVVDLTAPTEAQALQTRERVGYLDVAKGIGIILVVIGHAIGGLNSAHLTSDRSFLELIFYSIYSFHMPLFFFISALFVERRIDQDASRFFLSNLTRIAFPYFIWGVVQLLAEYQAQNLLNHPLTVSLNDQLMSIFWAPPAQFWFLYALFFLHLVALIAFCIGGSMAFALAFVMIFAGCAASPELQGLITDYASGTDILFYVLGACVGSSLLQWRGRIGRGYGLILIASLAFASLISVGWTRGIEPDMYAMLPAAIAGSVLVLLVSASDALRGNRVLAYLGRRALAIYALHVLFVAGTRIALVKGAHVSEVAIILPVIVVVGILAPLAIDRGARSLRLSAQLGLP